LDNNLERILLQNILFKKNVIGYSKNLQYKITKGKVIQEDSIRFYVKKKVPLKSLYQRDILPMSIMDIPTDVVVGGEWEAPLPIKKPKIPSKTDRIRPLLAGISIGNWSITAGTSGWYYKKVNDITGGTNAHINSDDPSKEVSTEKRIVQPGKYDKGTLNDIIGKYLWHKQINPIGGISNCGLSNGVIYLLNNTSKFFGRKTRFTTYKEIQNNIDFGVFSLDVEYRTNLIDFDPLGFNGVGHGFVGSDQTSLICKGKPYIENEGYKPLFTEFVDVVEGNIIHKTGRTTCYSKAPVIDRSGVSQVNYGSYIALFDDVIITEHLLDGGDSGSFCWVKEE